MTAITHRFRLGQLTIDVLSDDDLLYIFSLYRQELSSPDDTWPWHTLLHVSQRWRRIIFAWPHHLDLRLDCKSEADVAKALVVWPALPISIQSELNHVGGDGIISALEHCDRIAGIKLSGLTVPQLERCAVLMQEQFPVLRTLSLSCRAGLPSVISDAFFGGSAPRLQTLRLSEVPFTTLPSLLLSARNLVKFHIEHNTGAGYISPDSMATCLSMLTRLQSVIIAFRVPDSFPQHQINRYPAPPTRSVLPALARLSFEGDSEYSEDLLARIDAPLLSHLSLRFSYQPVFDIPQVPRFIHGSEMFKPPLYANVEFDCHGVDISMLSPLNATLFVQSYCSGSDTQLEWLQQTSTQLLPLLSNVDELDLSNTDDMRPHEQEDTLWLGILRLFNAVEILSIYDEVLEVDIAGVLGGLTGERAVEMLPMLHTLVLSGFDDIESTVTPLLKSFIEARQLSHHPVVVR
jgi:hypothetical protein